MEEEDGVETSNRRVAHMPIAANGDVNAVVNRLQTVARASAIADVMVAERRPGVHSSQKVIRLRGDVSLIGSQRPVRCVSKNDRLERP